MAERRMLGLVLVRCCFPGPVGKQFWRIAAVDEMAACATPKNTSSIQVAFSFSFVVSVGRHVLAPIAVHGTRLWTDRIWQSCCKSLFSNARSEVNIAKMLFVVSVVRHVPALFAVDGSSIVD
ncbi:hypothetical protein PM082_013137 [Marasmius tenuissimus]|nr:hypothetical protein PM082_013137 [Marasmius tenuissimus]